MWHNTCPICGTEISKLWLENPVATSPTSFSVTTCSQACADKVKPWVDRLIADLIHQRAADRQFFYIQAKKRDKDLAGITVEELKEEREHHWTSERSTADRNSKEWLKNRCRLNTVMLAVERIAACHRGDITDNLADVIDSAMSEVKEVKAAMKSERLYKEST